jgi:hypothetical protein
MTDYLQVYEDKGELEWKMNLEIWMTKMTVERIG